MFATLFIVKQSKDGLEYNELMLPSIWNPSRFSSDQRSTWAGWPKGISGPSQTECPSFWSLQAPDSMARYAGLLIWLWCVRVPSHPPSTHLNDQTYIGALRVTKQKTKIGSGEGGLIWAFAKMAPMYTSIWPCLVSISKFFFLQWSWLFSCSQCSSVLRDSEFDQDWLQWPQCL